MLGRRAPGIANHGHVIAHFQRVARGTTPGQGTGSGPLDGPLLNLLIIAGDINLHQ